MTPKLYRKALAKLALATSILLSGLIATEAMAHAQVNGLTRHDLLNGSARTVHSGARLAPMVPSAKRDRAIQPVAQPVIQPAIQPAGAASAVIVPANPAIAQSTPVTTDDTFAPLSDDEIRELLLLEPNRLTDQISRRPRAIPSSSFLTPTAYGASWRQAYVGLALATEGDRSKADGSASLGVGFGDPIENVGLEVSVDIISLDGFAEDGIAGFKLHKIFPKADNLAVALGWSNPIKWGSAKERDNLFYGVVTKKFDLQPNKSNPLPLTASLGISSGDAFRGSSTPESDSDGSVDVFGSLGLRIIPEVSLITSWTGDALGIAASAAPFNQPFIFTLGASDVTGSTAEGTRFNGSVGYSFSF
ncbi:MAG: hypothetical protein WBA76_13700 [Phormidesmis sp.]